MSMVEGSGKLKGIKRSWRGYGRWEIEDGKAPEAQLNGKKLESCKVELKSRVEMSRTKAVGTGAEEYRM